MHCNGDERNPLMVCSVELGLWFHILHIYFWKENLQRIVLLPLTGFWKYATINWRPLIFLAKLEEARSANVCIEHPLSLHHWTNLNLTCWLKPISTRPNPFQTHLNPSQGITIQPVLTLGGCSSSPSMRSLSPNRSAYRTMICQNLSRPFQTILVQFISPQFQIQFEINWQFLTYQSQPTSPTQSLNPNKSTQVRGVW